MELKFFSSFFMRNIRFTSLTAPVSEADRRRQLCCIKNRAAPIMPASLPSVARSTDSPSAKRGHHAAQHALTKGLHQQLFLRAHAAADEYHFRIKDVYKARHARCDIVDPCAQHAKHDLIAPLARDQR